MVMPKVLHLGENNGIWKNHLRKGQIKDGKYFDHIGHGIGPEELRKIADIIANMNKKHKDPK
jgi:hypothetical protein